MKRNPCSICAFIILSLLMSGYCDEWFDADTGYTWSYRLSENEFTVTGAYINEYGCSWSYSNKIADGGIELYAVVPKPTGHLVIPSCINDMTVTALGAELFAGCSLDTVELPTGLRQVGDSAFGYFSQVDALVLPDTLETLGWRAGLNLSGVRLVLPAKLRYIPDQALYSDEVETLVLPSGFMGMGQDAFVGMPKLNSFELQGESESFSVVDGFLCSKDGKTLVKCPSGRKDVAIPNGIENIEMWAFNRCTLSSVIIPQSVTNISACAFYSCLGTFDISLPNGIVSIGSCAFRSCAGLENLNLGLGIRIIGDRAFSNCSSLQYLTIPNSVVDLGVYPFDWSGLKKVVFEGNAPAQEFYRQMFTWAYPEANAAWSAPVFYIYSDAQGWDVAKSYWDSSQLRVIAREDTTSSDELGNLHITTATVYDGRLWNETDRTVAGTIQVKAAKEKANKKTGLTTTTLTISILLADSTKKISLSCEYDLSKGELQTLASKDRSITLQLGTDGMTGSFEGLSFEGVRNVFSSKDADSKAKAAVADATYVGAYNAVAGEGTFSITIAKKGKAKIAGTLTSGKKVSASTQLLVGDDAACVPVVLPKYGLSFTVWLGETIAIDGLTDAVVGPAGTLADGAKFNLNTEALTALVKDATYAAYFPDGLSVTQQGTKWIVAGGAKTGSVVLKKDKSGVDESKLGANPSALKLTYTAKSGSFKGKFKAYVNVKDKPKALSATVTGFLIDGIGYGTATIKKYGAVDIEIR